PTRRCCTWHTADGLGCGWRCSERRSSGRAWRLAISHDDPRPPGPGPFPFPARSERHTAAAQRVSLALEHLADRRQHAFQLFARRDQRRREADDLLVRLLRQDAAPHERLAERPGRAGFTP